MAKITGDFRHHLVNGLCGIRASEQILRDGYEYMRDSNHQVLRDTEGHPIKTEVNLQEHLNNIDYQLKRIFAALEEFEK